GDHRSNLWAMRHGQKWRILSIFETAAKPLGPFWLILDSLGGFALSAAPAVLQPGGYLRDLRGIRGHPVTFESRDFFATGGVRLYELTLFHELMSVGRAGIGLALLADLIAAQNCGRRSRLERSRHGRVPAFRSRVNRQAVMVTSHQHEVVMIRIFPARRATCFSAAFTGGRLAKGQETD